MKNRKIYLIILIQTEGLNDVIAFKTKELRDDYWSRMRLHGDLRAYKRDEELIDTWYWLEKLIYDIKKFFKKVISKISRRHGNQDKV